MREPGWSQAEWEAVSRYRRAELESEAEERVRRRLIGFLWLAVGMVLAVVVVRVAGR